MTSPTGSPAAAKTCLCIATSGPEGSLALGTHALSWNKKAMHSDLATLKLDELLRQSGLRINQLTHIAVGVGPGSFTGIRVGINLGRSLAYALGLPIAALDSFTLLAHREARPGESILIALKAVQNFFYVAGLQIDTDQGPRFRLTPRSATQDELPALARDYALTRVEGETPGFGSAFSADLIHSYMTRWPTVFTTWPEVRPVYVRGSEPEEKLRRGLLKPMA